MWIESHQSLRNHRKTGRLARRLGIGRVAAIGHLHCFWWWCMDNAPNGSLAGIDAEDIADGAEWEGDPSDFIAALDYAGFIQAETIHDWYDYAGKLIERRQKDAARKRESRNPADDPPPQPLPNRDVPRTSDGHPEDGVRTVPNRTVPNRTEPNKTKESTGRATRATPAPDVFPVSDEMRQWATANAPGVDVDLQTQRFLDRNRAEGKAYKDWPAAWRNWITSPYSQPTARAPAVRAAHTNGFQSDDAFAKNLAHLRAVGRVK